MVHSTLPIVDYNEFKYVLIVHAGSDEAITGDPYDILSSTYVAGLVTNDGTVQLNIAVISELDPIGVVAHEIAHPFWIPDLYDYEGAVEFVGRWDSMGAGAYNGPSPGSSPAHQLVQAKTRLDRGARSCRS